MWPQWIPDLRHIAPPDLPQLSMILTYSKVGARMSGERLSNKLISPHRTVGGIHVKIWCLRILSVPEIYTTYTKFFHLSLACLFITPSERSAFK